VGFEIWLPAQTNSETNRRLQIRQFRIRFAHSNNIKQSHRRGARRSPHQRKRSCHGTFSDTPILRIDPDELRNEFEAYQGGNARLFQGAVSILVGKLIDLALDRKQSFLLDGTLSNIEIARNNVQRCLNKGRFVQILYVYQDPRLAWSFVRNREEAEGRRIRPEHFVDQYFAARDVVNTLLMATLGITDVAIT